MGQNISLMSEKLTKNAYCFSREFYLLICTLTCGVSITLFLQDTTSRCQMRAYMSTFLGSSGNINILHLIFINLGI